MNAPLQILILDDDVVDRKAIQRQLKQTGLSIEIQESASVKECIVLMQQRKFDCILLDYQLPEMNGIDLLTILKDNTAEHRPATVMLTGNGNETLVVKAMRLGVQDYLVKGELSPSALEKAIRDAVEARRLEQAEEAESRRLEQLAMVDAVTGIGNRNLFNMRFEHAVRRARREGDHIALLYLDLNRFKEVNDTLGHAAGDQVLRETAQRLKATARDSDTVARLSGDEFAIIMETSVSRPGAERLAARVQEAFAVPFMIGSRSRIVACSIGIALYPDDAEKADALMRIADAKMYEAKFGGRLN